MKSLPITLALVLFTLLPAFAEEGYTDLFNGTDLTGWDGDPALWKVENGTLIGTCSGPESPKHNDFLIWRGGVLKDFELHVKARVIGDNNSGVQYRSRPLPEVGPWAITGYQCDIHPAIQHTGMTYEEKGRGIFGLNGQSMILDPDGKRWIVSEHEPVAVDVAEWNEYTIIARGNHLIHQINGKLTSEVTDYDVKNRALEGLLAIQLHSGNPNTVEIKEIRLKTLTDGKVTEFTDTTLPETAKEVEKPKTANPQGLGTPAAKGK
jgi:hypothetical protein